MNAIKSNDKAIKYASSHNTTPTTISFTTLPFVPTRHYNNQKHSHDYEEHNINENISNSFTHSKCGFGKVT